MENILALQAMRQDNDTAFAGLEASSSGVSVGCCDFGTVIVTIVITLIK